MPRATFRLRGQGTPRRMKNRVPPTYFVKGALQLIGVQNDRAPAVDFSWQPEDVWIGLAAIPNLPQLHVGEERRGLGKICTIQQSSKH
jgi:hypothetical protein